MDTHNELASQFVRAIDISGDWAIAGPRVLPILRQAREKGDAELAKMVEAVIATGSAEPVLAALGYLGDIIEEMGLTESRHSFGLLVRYLSPQGTPDERLGAAAGVGSIMDVEAARHLREAAPSETLRYISELEMRSAEVIERNVATDPENPNAFAMAI